MDSPKRGIYRVLVCVAEVVDVRERVVVVVRVGFRLTIGPFGGGVHVLGLKPRGSSPRASAPVHDDTGVSDLDARARRGPHARCDVGGGETRGVDGSSSFGVWPVFGRSSVRFVAGGASAKMARERRRAEFAAGARVQRIGEDGDLRTVGEEAVRGSGLGVGWRAGF